MKGFNHTLVAIATAAVLSSAALTVLARPPVIVDTVSATVVVAPPTKPDHPPSVTNTNNSEVSNHDSPVPEPTELETLPAKTPVTEAASVTIDEPTATAAPVSDVITPAKTSSEPQSEPGTNSTTLIDLVYELTNNVRAERGLPPLRHNAELTRVANERSQDMMTNNYFSHTTQDGCDLQCRFAATNLSTLTWGENIATYDGLHLTTAKEAIRTLFADWLASRGHRENILSETFTHQGVGIAIKGDELIITVVFASPQ